jgi:hypothetical protein
VFHRKISYYIVAVVLLASLVPLQRNIEKRRADEKIVILDRPSIRPGEAAIGLLLAGFRGVAANMLWFRATVLFEQYKVTEEIPIFQAISYLQPRFRATWSFGAWHIAYNVSAHFYDRPDLTDEEVDRYRFECFKIGEDFLRKGTQYNYYNYDLHWDLGFSILYYKQYKFLKEKGWAEADEALNASLQAMKTAALFQPPLARHPPYVDRIIAIIMDEAGMIEDAYKIWYRLKRWHKDEQNMELVKKHMDRVIDSITIQDMQNYALALEKDANLQEAYKTWCLLLARFKEKQAQLAKDQFADPDLVEEVNQKVISFTDNVDRMAEALRNSGADPQSLKNVALEEGIPRTLEDQIQQHFRTLEHQAEEDYKADRAETMSMFHELTKPAPPLDWWVYLFAAIFLLAAGYLIFGKEAYES